MIIKRVGVLSVAKMYGAVAAAFGLFAGVIVAIASMIGMGLSEGDEPAIIGTMLGAGAIVLLPLFYGCMGLIAGAIGGALYNLFAGMVGGIRIETE